MNKKKKGFTLIELLAIIVILAIVAVITVPIILNIIENSKRGAARNSAYGYKDAIYKFYAGKASENSDYSMPNGTYTINSENGYLVGTGDIASNAPLEIQFSGKKPNGGSIELEKNVIKQGCVEFDDYAIIITNGVVGEAVKGSCASAYGDGYLVVQDIIDTAVSLPSTYEEQVALKTPIVVTHPAIAAEASATGQLIPETTDYRYVGEDPDNYILFNCDPGVEQNLQTCELWRIISIEDGKLKIITEDRVGGKVPWDDTGETEGQSYTNNWPDSGLYKFLNGSYINNYTTYNYTDDGIEIAVSKKNYAFNYNVLTSGTGTVSTTRKRYSTLNASAMSKIQKSTWYLGEANNYSNDYEYIGERGIFRTGNNALTVLAYVGLMYPSDFYYASVYADEYSAVNWIKHGSRAYWCISPAGITNDNLPLARYTDYCDDCVGVISDLVYDYYHGQYLYSVRQTVYLKSDIRLTGTGKLSDPYKIM